MLSCLWACVPPTVHVLCAVLADRVVASGRAERLASICYRGLSGVRGVMETPAAFPDSPGGRLRASPGRVPFEKRLGSINNTTVDGLPNVHSDGNCRGKRQRLGKSPRPAETQDVQRLPKGKP